jgi:type VI secretion system protein ImpL
VTLVSVLGGDVGLVASGQVSGVYTKAAWDAPIGEFLVWVRQIEGDAAMAQAFGGRPAGLESELMRRYAGEYEGAWARFFSSIQVTPGVSDADAQVFLDRAAGENSPVLKLLRAAYDNARFGKDAPGEMGSVEDDFALLGEFLVTPGKDAAFRKVKQWVGRSGTPGKEYLQLVKELSGAYSEVAGTSDPGRTKQVLDLESWITTHIPTDTPIASEMGRVLRLPIQAVTKKVQAQAGAELESKWGNVYQEYAQNLAGRYPLSGGASETVALPDFEAFFSPDGTFWKYYESNLSKVITEDGTRILDPSASVSPEFKAALRSAYRIRRALFPVGSRAGFSVSLRTKPPLRPEGVSFFRSRLEIGGASLVYSSGQPRPVEISWPGENPGAGASLSMDLRETARALPLSADGVWGIFRLLDRASVSDGGAEVRVRWTVPTDKGDVKVEYTATGLAAIHPLEPGILRFSLPPRIAGGP